MSKDLSTLKDYLLSGITEQVKYEYETKKEFEEVYGPTDTIDEVINLICNLKDYEDICRVYCPACLDADPENYQHYLDLFEVRLSELENPDGKKYQEYITWGYDKDNDVYVEFYRGIEETAAIEVAEKKTNLLNHNQLYRILTTGEVEPIDWIEVVKSDAELCANGEYKDYLIWSSYNSFTQSPLG